MLPTSLVGSYPQPDWLINREMLSKRMPPRVRAGELWRVQPEYLELAQDDATLLAIRDQERAGLDIVTDGEARRESYSNRFATALDGMDLDNPGTILSRSGQQILVPRVTGNVRRLRPVQVRDVQFLRANTDRKIKITVPGPFTMAQLTQNDFYKDEEALAFDLAAAVNEEIRDLFAAGADVVQIDEPYMQAYPEKARKYAVGALNRALEGLTGTTAVHICFGYAALVPGRPAGLRVPDGTGRVFRAADLHRNSAIETGLLSSRAVPREEHHSRRDRFSTHDVETPTTRGGANPARAALHRPRTNDCRARLRNEVSAA